MGLLFFANYTLQPIIISPLCTRWLVIVGAGRKEKEPGFAFSSQNPPHARMVLLFPLSSDNDSSVFESSSAILGISFALIDNDVQWLPLRRRAGILRRQARSENWTIKEVLADCFDLYHAIPLQRLRWPDSDCVAVGAGKRFKLQRKKKKKVQGKLEINFNS